MFWLFICTWPPRHKVVYNRRTSQCFGYSFVRGHPVTKWFTIAEPPSVLVTHLDAATPSQSGLESPNLSVFRLLFCMWPSRHKVVQNRGTSQRFGYSFRCGHPVTKWFRIAEPSSVLFTHLYVAIPSQSGSESRNLSVFWLLICTWPSRHKVV